MGASVSGFVAAGPILAARVVDRHYIRGREPSEFGFAGPVWAAA
jgi:hypothetical protein